MALLYSKELTTAKDFVQTVKNSIDHLLYLLTITPILGAGMILLLFIDNSGLSLVNSKILNS